MRSFGANFATAIAGTDLEYFITAVFHFPNARGDIYVSDRPVTIGGNVHNPIVPRGAWGDVESLLPRDFQTLDFKQAEVKFINYPLDAQSPALMGLRFSDLLREVAAATEVDVYQNVRVSGTVYQEKLITCIMQGRNQWSLQGGTIRLRSLYEKYFKQKVLREVTSKEYPKLRASDEGALIPLTLGPSSKRVKGIVTDNDRGIVVFCESPQQGPITSIDKIYVDGYELGVTDVRAETTNLGTEHVFAMDGKGFDGGITLLTGSGAFVADQDLNNASSTRTITQAIKIPDSLVNPRITHIDIEANEITSGAEFVRDVTVKLRRRATSSTSRPDQYLQNDELMVQVVPTTVDYGLQVPTGSNGLSIDSIDVPVTPGETLWITINCLQTSVNTYLSVPLYAAGSNPADVGVGNAIKTPVAGFSTTVLGGQLGIALGLKGDLGTMTADDIGASNRQTYTNGDPFATDDTDAMAPKTRGLLKVGFDITKARLATHLETYNWGITGASVSDSNPLTVELTSDDSVTGGKGGLIASFSITPSEMSTAIQASVAAGTRVPVLSAFPAVTLLPPGRYWLEYIAQEIATPGASQPGQRISMFVGGTTAQPPVTPFNPAAAEGTFPGQVLALGFSVPPRKQPGEPYFAVDFGIRVVRPLEHTSVPDVPGTVAGGTGTNRAHYVTGQAGETHDVATADFRITGFSRSLEDFEIRADVSGGSPYSGATPDRMIHLIAHRAGVPDSRIDLAGSFATARTAYAAFPGPYAFDAIVRDQVDVKTLLIAMAYQARSAIDWNVDTLKLKVLPLTAGTPVATIAKTLIVPQGIVPRLTVSDPDPDTIINSAKPRYARDWTDDGVKWLGILPEIVDQASINVYGLREGADGLFDFWLIEDENMCSHVSQYWLNRRAKPRRTAEVTVKLPLLALETDDQVNIEGV